MFRWWVLVLVACGPPLSGLVEPARGTLAPPSTGARVRVTHATETYALHGASAAALRTDLSRQRPSDERFTGWTRWRLRWRFSPHTDAVGCTLDDVVVELHLTTVLPTWEAPARATPGLRRAWATYTTALETHEAIHGHLAVAAAHHLARDLEHLGHSEDCERLEARAEVVGRAHVRELRAANARFDAETQHGAATGAVFPGASGPRYDGP